MLFIAKIIAALFVMVVINYSFNSQDTSKNHSDFWNHISEDGMVIN